MTMPTQPAPEGPTPTEPKQPIDRTQQSAVDWITEMLTRGYRITARRGDNVEEYQGPLP